MSILQFDGAKDYIEIPDDIGFSVATTGTLTVAAWMRPDVLTFPNSEGTGYVHWMGKGGLDQQEWTFRMYNETTTDNPPRPNRISFYVFNPQGGKGVGSYFQEPVQAGEWIHVVGIADGQNALIYKNGAFKKSESYSGIITPQHASCTAARRNSGSQELLPRRNQGGAGLESRAHGSGSANGRERFGSARWIGC